MADVFSKKKRSWLMSRVRSRGNKKTELALLSLFRQHRISGWRRHLALPGTPDFAFPRARVAVFVDGCFWHACPRCGTRPANNAEFWKAKFVANRRRDRIVGEKLRERGWTVVRIWQHQLRKPDRVINKISMSLQERDKDPSKRSFRNH